MTDLRLDQYCFEACQSNQSGSCSFWFSYKFFQCMVNRRLRLFFPLTVERCKLRRLDKRSVRNFFFVWVAYNNMASGIICRVHPCIARICDPGRQMVIIRCLFTNQDLKSVSRCEGSNTGRDLGSLPSRSLGFWSFLSDKGI